MSITKLLYLENFTLLECEAKVIAVENENGRDILILDQTCFYPQGGGQPYDKGIIESNSGKFIVEETRFVDGAVRHIGSFEKGAFKQGDTVACKVEKDRRELNSRLHSAGHLVDMALATIKPDWIPGKGYHFPDGPYVEYQGTLDPVESEKLSAIDGFASGGKTALAIAIEERANRIISDGCNVKIVFADKKEMAKLCRFVPDYIPEGKPGRVVRFGEFGVPCGGTHVSNLSEINPTAPQAMRHQGGFVLRGLGSAEQLQNPSIPPVSGQVLGDKIKSMTIRKIKPEREIIRIGYDVTREK